MKNFPSTDPVFNELINLQLHLKEIEKRMNILVDALKSIRDHTAHSEYGSPAYAHRIAKSALEEAKV